MREGRTVTFFCPSQALFPSLLTLVSYSSSTKGQAGKEECSCGSRPWAPWALTVFKDCCASLRFHEAFETSLVAEDQSPKISHGVVDAFSSNFLLTLSVPKGI